MKLEKITNLISQNSRELELLAQGKLDTFKVQLNDEEKIEALAFLKNELREEVEELNTEEVLNSRHGHFQIEGTSKEDYREEVFKSPNGEIFKMGIRHFNGEKDLPFVNVESTCLPPSNELKDFIKSYYSKFSPRHISFHYQSKPEVEFVASVTMVTRALTYKEHPSYKSEVGLELKVENNEQTLDWYEAGYKSFHEKYPELKVKVPVNDRETMMESLEAGLLYGAYVKEKRVGLIAGIRSPFLGQPGLYFNEIFITEEMKGKGLGKALQKLMVLEVCAGTDFVWGTIDENNQASYQTAYSNGRRPVSYECFIEL